MSDSKPVLLVVATGSRLYREYLLRSIATEYRVHLVVDAAPTWERDYIADSTVVASTLDAEQLVQAAKAIEAELGAAGDRIAGVLCWDEARILPAAAVVAALGLPGAGPDVIGRCRDKHLTRAALDAAGVPQPRSVLVGTADDAAAAAASIGYPVVLKPRALAASLGVVLVEDETQLRAQFGFARDTTVPEAPHYDVSVLVEEYADGPEISIDAVVHGGAVSVLCLARKEVGYPPYFEELGHTVDAADPLLIDPPLLALLHATHAALDFADGVTHTEVRLTPRGPRVIEVNARLGGDLIPYLGLRSSGIDPGLAAAAAACGLPPRAEAHRADKALVGAVRFGYVPHRMTIASIGFDAAALPAGIDQAVVLTEPGRTVAPPPEGATWGRITFTTAVAGSAAECAALLDGADAAFRLTGTEGT